jgi:hypothetical protein
MDKRPPQSKTPRSTTLNPLADLQPMTPAETGETGGNQNDSVAAVEAFKKVSGSAGSSPVSGTSGESGGPPGSGDEEVEKVDVSAEALAADELRDMAAMLAQLDGTQLSLERDRNLIEWQNRSIKRAQQIEDRVKPLRLTEFLIRDFLEQEVPVNPEEGFILTFRTIPNAIQLSANKVARQVLATWDTERDDEGNRLYMQQVAALSVGLVRIENGSPWPAEISLLYELSADGSRREELEAAIKQNMEWWLKKPVVWTQELIEHHTAFKFRVRKALGTTGFIESEVGK